MNDTRPSAEDPDRLHVVAVCCGQGFPHGMALAYRLKMVGQALTEAGARFSLFHVGGSPFKNDAARGRWRDLEYRYFPPSTTRDPRRWPRLWKNMTGLLAAANEVRRLRARERVVVYSDMYVLENLLLASTGAPVVAEISEWYPGRTDRTWWPRFIASAGAVPISRALEDRVASRMARWRRSFPQLRLPILMDSRTDAVALDGPVFEPPYLLWAGDPYGEIRAHVEFLVEVLGGVRARHPTCRLVLLGNFGAGLKADLEAMAARVAGSASAIVVHGFVPKAQLAAPIAGAAALVAPLPTGVRWECCFPTKLGEYLASGRPVVSSRVGEVGAYLSDGETAMIAEPGDLEGWRDRIVRLLDDSALASRIGAAGRELARREFDYRVHSQRLYEFLDGLAGPSRRRT